MRATRLPWLSGLLMLPLAASLCCAGAARAEGDDEANPPQEDIRFDLFKADGEVYRFDRKTGEILKIVKTKEGFMAVPQPVLIAGKSATRAKPDAPRSAKGANETETAQSDPSTKKLATCVPPIQFFNEQGEDITYEVSDQDREAAKGTILAYRDGLSLLQTLDIGERISGNVLVRNIGERRLKVLELTLQVPVVGRDKPEEHRFLYVDRPGKEDVPPQPTGGGKEGKHLLQKIDLPSPPGGIKGSPILRVSYLKFAD
jgi:hypothetical protein